MSARNFASNSERSTPARVICLMAPDTAAAELNELSPINASDVVVSSSNLPAGCILNVDGTFSVVLGTPSGNYSFDYQVCEIANPNNCIIGSGILILTKNINASADFIQYEIAPNAAPIQSIIANDTLNGVSPINTGDVIVTATNLPVGVLLNNDGTLTFAQNFGATNFSFDYQICESNSTNNCANSTCFVVITKKQRKIRIYFCMKI